MAREWGLYLEYMKGIKWEVEIENLMVIRMLEKMELWKANRKAFLTI